MPVGVAFPRSRVPAIPSIGGPSMNQGMTHREFVKKGLTMVAVGLTAPSFITRTALAMNNPWDVTQLTSRPGVPDDRVLVVVQLGGGTDGVNVGPAMPLAMQASSGTGVSLEDPEAFQWMPALNGIGAKEEQELFRLLNAPAVGAGGNGPETIDFLRHTAMNAYVSSAQVREAARGYRGGV